MGRLLKVSMSDDMYEAFINDAKEKYDNCYWLKISADEKIYKGIAGAVLANEDIIDAIENVRKELIELVNNKYLEDIYPLKKEIKKLKGL